MIYKRLKEFETTSNEPISSELTISSRKTVLYGYISPAPLHQLTSFLKETVLPINKGAFKYENFTLGEKSPKTEFHNNG